jgi:radical SAM protein with 4Fe4S-binding SPASM domain
VSGLLKHKIHWWRLRTEWYRKKLVLSQPPYFINLEPTGFCNLRCTVCSYRQDRGKGYVDLGLAERIIEDAARFGVSQVRFFLAGEPLFHPHLDKMIAQARRNGMLTQIHTNANYLDKKRAAKLLDSGLDSISFSFDGETREEYDAIRVGGDFEITFNNIIQFLQMKKDRGTTSPFVSFQVIKPYRENLPFFPTISDEFKQKLDGLPIDRFHVIYPFSWPGQEEQGFNRPHGNRIFPCPVLWQSLSVGFDGRVFGCCGDLNGEVVLGDMHELSLQDVWNCDKIIEMRRLHLQKRHMDIPLCRECDAMYVRAHPVIRDVFELVTGRWNPL